MLRRLVSAQILPFRTVGFFLAVNQNTVTRHIVSWGLASKYFVVEEGIWSDCFVGYGQISCGS
jgi:hypothetical protein